MVRLRGPALRLCRPFLGPLQCLAWPVLRVARPIARTRLARTLLGILSIALDTEDASTGTSNINRRVLARVAVFFSLVASVLVFLLALVFSKIVPEENNPHDLSLLSLYVFEPIANAVPTHWASDRVWRWMFSLPAGIPPKFGRETEFQRKLLERLDARKLNEFNSTRRDLASEDALYLMSLPFLGLPQPPANLSHFQLPACDFSPARRKRYEVLIGKRIFVAANFHGSQKVLPNTARQLLLMREFLTSRDSASTSKTFSDEEEDTKDYDGDLGTFLARKSANTRSKEPLFISIYENGSKDLTTTLLFLWKRVLEDRGIPHRIISKGTTEMTDWSKVARIAELARLRNKLLEPLLQGAAAPGKGQFDAVLFLNDVFFCAEDALEMIYQLLVAQAPARNVEAPSRNTVPVLANPSHLCGLDFFSHETSKVDMPGGGGNFYDTWVTRALNGEPIGEPLMWFFDRFRGDPVGKARFEKGLPVQVYSCWNGISVFLPHPFELGIKFRTVQDGSTECPASECSLLDKDLWNAGMGRIGIVPRVRVAYGFDVFDDIFQGQLEIDRGYYADSSKRKDEKIEWREGPENVVCYGLPTFPGARHPGWKNPVWEDVDEKTRNSVVGARVTVDELADSWDEWKGRVGKALDLA